MSQKKPQLTSLAARKKLLLMESDLNRNKFVHAVAGLKQELHRSKQHLTSLGTLASFAGRVATAVPAIGGLFARRSLRSGKSKLPFLVNGMVTGTSLWFLMKSLRRKS